MSETVRGACLCGAIRFEAKLPSKFCAHCHCSNCRRAHGAAFVTWVGFRSSQLRFTHGAAELRDYDTDTEARRSFCGKCGTTLFYRGPRWDDEIHVTRASIEDEIDRAPGGHVYVDHAASWWSIDDQLPQCGGDDGMQAKRRRPHGSQ